MAKFGSTQKPIPPGIFLEHLHEQTIPEDPYVKPDEAGDPEAAPNPDVIQGPEAVNLVQEVLIVNPDWTLPFIVYLLMEDLPEDEVEAR